MVVYSTKYPKNVLKKTFLHLASQAGKAFFSLHKQSRPVVDKLSPVIAFKVFDSLGVRKQTPTPAIYSDTGRFPLIIRQHIKAVKY